MQHIPEMDAAYDPAAWHDFGVALVSASAALLGLVFVVVSIHLRAVVDDPVLRRRAEIMLGLLATTFAASAALVIPGQSREALGIELMPIALVYISLSVLATFRATHSPRGVSRDRLARFFLGELALVDGQRPSKSEADSIRPRLEEAKREAEALSYAEERAAGALDRLPREQDEWRRAARRSLGKARTAYTDAIGEVARARDQLSDEATLLSYLENHGQFVQAITGAIQRPGGQPISFDELTKAMLEEAGNVEERARRDPNQP